MPNLKLKILLILALVQSGPIFSQNDPTGKSYTALMSTSCKEAINGGCTIQNYCTLKFEKDSVAILYFEKQYCSPKAAGEPNEVIVKHGATTYSWSGLDTKIIIKNFSDFAGLYFAGENVILGARENYGKVEGLRFKVSKE